MAENEVDLLTTQLLEELEFSASLRAELDLARRQIVALRAGSSSSGHDVPVSPVLEGARA